MFGQTHDQFAAYQYYASSTADPLPAYQPLPGPRFSDVGLYLPLSDEQSSFFWGTGPLPSNNQDDSPDSTPPGLSTSTMPGLFPSSPRYSIPPAVLQSGGPSGALYPPALGFADALDVEQPALGLYNDPTLATVAPAQLYLHPPSQHVPAPPPFQDHAQLAAAPLALPPSPPSQTAPIASSSSSRNPRKRIIDEAEYLENVNKPRAKKGLDGKRACTVAGCTERVTGEQLKRHLKSHLPAEIKNDCHRCLCGKAYSRQDALRRHRNSCPYGHF